MISKCFDHRLKQYGTCAVFRLFRFNQGSLQSVLLNKSLAVVFWRVKEISTDVCWASNCQSKTIAFVALCKTYSIARDLRLLNTPSGREVIVLEDKSLYMYEDSELDIKTVRT